jgi:hypothetical protein
LVQVIKIGLRGNFVLAGDVICFTIFSRELIPEERGFQIYHTNLPMIIINCLQLYIACHDSLDPLFQNLGLLDSRLGGCGTRVISDLFFKFAGR